jgi:hypothetical protein
MDIDGAVWNRLGECVLNFYFVQSNGMYVLNLLCSCSMTHPRPPSTKELQGRVSSYASIHGVL